MPSTRCATTDTTAKGPPLAVLFLLGFPGSPGWAGAALLPILGPQADAVPYRQGHIPGTVEHAMAAAKCAVTADSVIVFGIERHRDHLKSIIVIVRLKINSHITTIL